MRQRVALVPHPALLGAGLILLLAPQDQGVVEASVAVERPVRVQGTQRHLRRARTVDAEGLAPAGRFEHPVHPGPIVIDPCAVRPRIEVDREQRALGAVPGQARDITVTTLEGDAALHDGAASLDAHDGLELGHTAGLRQLGRAVPQDLGFSRIGGARDP